MIWYSPDGGGPVFPNRPNSGIPTYNAADATYTEPYLRGGGQAIMSGPTYHYDRVDTSSGVAWPKYWDDKWFIGDESNAANRVAVTVDPAGVPTQTPPAFAETLRPDHPGSGSGDNSCRAGWTPSSVRTARCTCWTTAAGSSRLDPNQKLIKISYTGRRRRPRLPAASNVAVQNKPLTYQFNGSKSGGVSYKWEFGDGTTSTRGQPEAHLHPHGSVHRQADRDLRGRRDGRRSADPVNVGCVVVGPEHHGDVRRTRDTTVQNKNAGGGCKVDDMIDDESTWATHAGVRQPRRRRSCRRLKKLGHPQREPAGQAERRRPRRRTSASPVSTGYDAIFDGTDQSLHGWAQAPSGKFTIQPDGSLRAAGGLGMLWYAKKAFGDFSVKLQFKDIAPGGHPGQQRRVRPVPGLRTPLAQRPPGSCGTVGSARTSQAWVAIYCGHEVQIYDGDTGEPQKTGSIYNFDPVALETSGATPKGQWNDLRDQGRRPALHDHPQRRGDQRVRQHAGPGVLARRVTRRRTCGSSRTAYIGLQNHSDNDLIEFRNIRVRQL